MGELLKQLEDLKNELAQLRVAKLSGQGGPSKLAKIKVVRKDIARVLTVYNQTIRSRARAQYSKQRAKYIPLTLREKKTRAIRQRLTPEQAARKTLKQQKKEAYYPTRVYALSSSS